MLDWILIGNEMRDLISYSAKLANQIFYIAMNKWMFLYFITMLLVGGEYHLFPFVGNHKITVITGIGQGNYQRFRDSTVGIFKSTQNCLMLYPFM